MRKQFSIIVPIYNGSAVLDETIESIINQTYTNFEIILVNDGSTDDSGVKCDLWAEKDARIHVIHQKNGGVSSARNSGIEKSTGEYICFVDADDSLLPNALEYFKKAITDFPEADFIKTNYKVKTKATVINTRFATIREPYKNMLMGGGDS